MEKKDVRKIVVAFLVILLIGVAIDFSKTGIESDGVILRNEVGEDERDMHLIFNIEGQKDSYEYPLQVEPIRVVEEQAKRYFAGAIEEINKDFAQRDVCAVPAKASYQSGIVEAKWTFEPWNLVYEDGTVVQERIPDEGVNVSAEVILSCGKYEETYVLGFWLTRKEVSLEDKIVSALDEWMIQEMEKEGEQILQLPNEIEGVRLRWSEKEDSLTVKLLLLEGIAAVLLWYLQKRAQENKKRKLEESMERDYPDIVEQLALLLGAGMTIRQAWNRIATRYSDKRQKEQVLTRPVFEKIVLMNRRLSEGENERIAYQKFADEVGIMCYYRLIRSLLGNLEKGSMGINDFLEQESKQAYEQRITQAKKLGEEASTRLLVPLFLMMMVVMAIAMVPALVNFSI